MIDYIVRHQKMLNNTLWISCQFSFCMTARLNKVLWMIKLRPDYHPNQVVNLPWWFRQFAVVSVYFVVFSQYFPTLIFIWFSEMEHTEKNWKSETLNFNNIKCPDEEWNGLKKRNNVSKPGRNVTCLLRWVTIMTFWISERWDLWTPKNKLFNQIDWEITLRMKKIFL